MSSENIWSVRTSDDPHDGRFLLSDEPHPDIRKGNRLEIPGSPREIEITSTVEIAQRELHDLPEAEIVLQSERLEPLEYYAGECLWSARLVDAAREAGVDNLQIWPVELVHPLTDRRWDRFAVNVVGRMSSNRPTGLRVARAEDSLTLLLADPVKMAWELLGLTSLVFVRQHPLP